MEADRPKWMDDVQHMAAKDSPRPDGDLRLPVRLWMEGSIEPETHSQDGKQFCPEFTDEHRVPIRNDHLGHSMQPKYIIYEQPSILSGGHLFRTWYEVGHLCQTVNKHSDGSFALGLWQISDQVHSDLLPSSLRNKNGLQNTGLFPTIGFHALTNRTRPHIRCAISP